MIDKTKYIEISPGIWYEKATGLPWTSKVQVGGKKKWILTNNLKRLNATEHGYWQINVNGKRYKWHRLVYEFFNGNIKKDLVIDHINNNRKDARIENLQLVDFKYNARKQKKKSNNKTGYQGVVYHIKRNHYISQIGLNINGKRFNKYLGSFPTPELAYEVYLKAKIKHHGADTIAPLKEK